MDVQPVFLAPNPVQQRQRAGPEPEPYRGLDLEARRAAVGLMPEDLAPILQIGLTKYRSRETGALPAAAGIVNELIAMEEFVASQAAALVADVPVDGTVELQAIVDQDAFTTAYPDAATLREGVAYPLQLQHVAVGRAAGELTRNGRNVEVYRASRRADLLVRRLATGLLRKTQTAYMLDVSKDGYYSMEKGVKPATARILGELQAVDDFISTAIAELDVTDTDTDGDTVVHIAGHQDLFEQAYPKACTIREGNAYPIWVLRVAAARRAHQLQRAGHRARIAHT